MLICYVIARNKSCRGTALSIGVNLSPSEWNGRYRVPLASRLASLTLTRLHKRSPPTRTKGKSDVLKPAQAGASLYSYGFNRPANLS